MDLLSVGMHQNILSYLSPKELSRVQLTSCSLAEATRNEGLWKRLCLLRWPGAVALDPNSHRQYYKVTNQSPKARTAPNPEDVLVLMTLTEDTYYPERGTEIILSRAVSFSDIAKGNFQSCAFVFSDDSTTSLELDQESGVVLDVSLYNKSTKQSLPLLFRESHCYLDGQEDWYDDGCHDPYKETPYCSQERCCAWDHPWEGSNKQHRPNKEALCFHNDIDDMTHHDSPRFVVQVTIHDQITLQFNYVSVISQGECGTCLKDHGYHDGSETLSRLQTLHWK
jgi:hypothetical protein